MTSFIIASISSMNISYNTIVTVICEFTRIVLKLIPDFT